MSRRKDHIKKDSATLTDINKGVQTLVETSRKTGEKLDDIKYNADELVKSSRAKLPLIVAIIGVVVTIIGIIIPIVKPTAESLPDISSTDTAGFPPNISSTDIATSTYEIYLYSDYKRVEVGFQTDITASLNFDTDSVNIDAYRDSVHNGDTVIMTQKNSTEWQAKVYFQETGTFEIVATATAPDGNVIEGTVEIEVIPVGGNIMDQIFRGKN